MAKTNESTITTSIKCNCKDGDVWTTKRTIKDVKGKTPKRTGVTFWQGAERKVSESADGFSLTARDVVSPAKRKGKAAPKKSAAKKATAKPKAAKKAAPRKAAKRAPKAKASKESDRRGKKRAA